MRAYWFKTLAAAALFYAAILVVLCWVRTPIPAEYWVREAIVIKRYLAGRISSPKIVVLGGSSVLFGVDTAQMEEALHVPAFNLGLHASLPLADVLEEGRRAARPGDVLVLALEAHYYSPRPSWSPWQVTNAVAWNPASLDALSWWRRLEVFAVAAPPDLWWELLRAGVERKIDSRAHRAAELALAADSVLIGHYLEGDQREENNPYQAWDLDRLGNLPSFRGTRLREGGRSAALPAAIDAEDKELLAGFIAEMASRRVRVVFAYSPYYIEGTPEEGWGAAEEAFRKSAQEIGGEVIDRRDQLFFPKDLFYDYRYHLNAEGRALRTRILIESLRKGGYLPEALSP